jgi:hypothetical protein
LIEGSLVATQLLSALNHFKPNEFVRFETFRPDL